MIGHARGGPLVVRDEKGALDAVGASCSHTAGPLGEEPWSPKARFYCPCRRTPKASICAPTRGVEATRPQRIACYRVEKTRLERVRVGARQPAPASQPGPTTTAPPPENIVIVGAGTSGRARPGPPSPGAPSGSRTRPRSGSAPRSAEPVEVQAGNAGEWIGPLPSTPETIALETGAAGEVQRVDVAGRAVDLAAGRRVPFGKSLLLATGAEPMGLPVPEGDAPPRSRAADPGRTVAASSRRGRAPRRPVGRVQRAPRRQRPARARPRSHDHSSAWTRRRSGGWSGTKVGGFLRRLHEGGTA